ncbi:Cation/H(+) antiporter [Chara braunii]|uniref:Cation/H(+) antiporter n=1 Tax=Chara braunii TaxID=69332 RepID=A0A388K176_CHABU|nr:Cation/H(+) antiporter [Chara braunii]|eukprot:GBG63802.1 Cation/H(+) antiporter [Chara braunii]
MAAGTVSDGILAKPHNSLEFSVPLFIMQLFVVVVVTRLLALSLSPLGQPRVIAEIAGGILLGPTALGRIDGFTRNLFHKDALKYLDLNANVGLIFFVFMVGLEIDLESLKTSGRPVIAISMAGLIFPFVSGVLVSFFLYNNDEVMSRTIDPDEKIRFVPFLVFMGVAMSITPLAVLARILTDCELLTTEVGVITMIAAAVDAVLAWILLALVIALANAHGNPLISLYYLLLSGAFGAAMFFVVRPLIKKVVDKVNTVDPTDFPEYLVAFCLIACLVSAFIADLVGIHIIFGALVFGLILPKDGNLAKSLTSRIKDFVSTLLLPLYFVSTGLKTQLSYISSAKLFGILILLILVAMVGKIGGVYIAARATKLSNRKALIIGVLMNVKGLVLLIVLNIGLERNVIGETLFTIMVVMALFTTFITSPLVTYLVKSGDAQEIATFGDCPADDTSDLRLLVCAHGLHNIPSFVHLSDLSKGCKKAQLHVYLLLLRLAEHPERSSSEASKEGKPVGKRKEMEGIDYVGSLFQTYGRLAKVIVKTETVISSTSKMHEDICSSALDKKASMIILPFHISRCRGTSAESAGADLARGFRHVNLQVLRHARCSVGVLIHRGLGESADMRSSETTYNVLLLLFGGQDDQRALVYASRMLELPNVNLRTVRFSSMQHSQWHSGSHWPWGRGDGPHPRKALEKEKEIAVEERRRSVAEEMAVHDNSVFEVLKNEISSLAGRKSAQLTVEEVQTDDVVQAAIAAASLEDLDLIVVGRGVRPAPIVASPSREDHLNPDDAEELGVIGGALVAADTVVKASILVIQQHDPELDIVGVSTDHSLASGELPSAAAQCEEGEGDKQRRQG